MMTTVPFLTINIYSMKSRYTFAQFNGTTMSMTFDVDNVVAFIRDDEMDWTQYSADGKRGLTTHGKNILLERGDWLIIDNETNRFYQYLHYLIDGKS